MKLHGPCKTFAEEHDCRRAYAVKSISTDQRRVRMPASERFPRQDLSLPLNLLLYL